MILREATIKYKGYDHGDLGQSSKKCICCSCDSCGKVRWIQKYNYHTLCRSCSKLGDKNPMYGREYSKEERKKNK